jgi:L-ascorbate metabolism protein UlaG (beta-lactamase superfamily)
MALSITFLGHAGFLFDDGTKKLAVDPFLTENPIAVHSADDIEADYIALTHGHFDHISDTPTIAKRTGATVIGSFEIANYLGEQGIEQVEPGNPGGTIRTDFGSVTFTQAFHSSSFEGRYLGMPCGLVISMGGVTFYHAGDTGLFSDMKLIGEIYKPDVAAIPIGDRFTMDAALGSRAAEMVGAKHAIPIHYKTFPLLAQDASGFEPRGVVVKELEPGETWTVG